MRLPWAAVALTALAVLVAGYVAVHIGPGGSVSRIDQALEAIRKLGTSGWLGLVVLQIVVAVSGVLPASLVGVAAGTLYGPWIGFGLAAAGTLLGAILAFWFSRSLFRPWVVRLLRRRPQALGFDAALGRDGWKLVCLLRVSPVMPFVATSYALGLPRKRCGSTGWLPSRISKWSCGSVTLPVAPTRAMVWPRCTVSPRFTSRTSAWA